MVAIAPVSASELEPFRRELTGFCYRMLASGSEAEDAVQETMLRAWRHAEAFRGDSSLRTWLYRIATNVCTDMGRSAQRRARPMEMGPSSAPEESLLGPMLPEATWVTPIPDHRAMPDNADPGDVALQRESIRLAFVAALQHLPARQRAVLIFCEVLRWQAAEVADLLGTSRAAVNSALQRARAALTALRPESSPARLDEADADLLRRYVDAFERYDMEALTALLHQDAVMSMPPFAMWIRGARSIGAFLLEPTPSLCRGSRLVPVEANGCPGFGQYKPDPAGGHRPWALQVLEISGGRITGFHAFLDTERLFPLFDLPEQLPA